MHVKSSFFLFFSLAMLLISSTEMVAADRYWVATTTGNWNDANNWSETSGGVGGATVPTSSDVVYFDGAVIAGVPAIGNCILNVPVAILRAIHMKLGYTGQFDLNGNTVRVDQAATSNSSFISGVVTSGASTGTLIVTHNQAGGSVLFDGTEFGSNVILTVNGFSVYLNGSVFRGTTTITFAANGGNCGNCGQIPSDGGNTFDGQVSLISNGSPTGYPSLGNATADIFNGPLTVGGEIRLANNASGTEFNNTVTFANGANSTKIYIGEDTNGSAVIGTNGQFLTDTGNPYRGQLSMKRVTQIGNLSIKLLFSITSSLHTSQVDVGSSCVFNGDFHFQGRSLTIDGTNTTFNGAFLADFGYQTALTLRITNSPTFNADASFISNRGANYSSYVFTGTFNGDFSFSRTGVADIIVGFQSSPSTVIPCSFGGNVTVSNSTTQRIYGSFVGNNDQYINVSGGVPPTFLRLTMNKTPGNASNLILNTPIIADVVVFTDGRIIATPPNVLNYNSCTSPTATDKSHVQGAVRKSGTCAFTFPIGAGGIHRSLSISAPSSTTEYQAEFVYSSPRSAPGLGSSLDGSLFSVSDCEYWKVEQTSGGADVNLTLRWGAPNAVNCRITVPSELRVAQWNGTQWVGRGNSFYSGDGSDGTVVSGLGSITDFSPPSAYFAVASSTSSNPLPIVLVDFVGFSDLRGVMLKWKTSIEKNNEKFVVEHSMNGMEFTEIGDVAGAGNSVVLNSYEFIHVAPGIGRNYYRIKQVDFDGNFDYSFTIRVEFLETGPRLFPNPISQGGMLTTSYTGGAAILNNVGIVVQVLQNAASVDTSHLGAGSYIIKFDDNTCTRFHVVGD